MATHRAFSSHLHSPQTPRHALLPAPRVEPPRPRARAASLTAPLFRSYWMGGFEGADHVGSAERPVSMCDLTQHREYAGADYARLAELGIRTVRESAGWRLIDRRGRLDFSALTSRARAASMRRMQIVWTLFHYGWPADIDVFSSAFVDRFARYAGAAAAYLGEYTDGAPVYAPINEISFLAWSAAGPNHAGLQRSRIAGRAAEFKCQLVRAAIAACEAILDVDPRARFIHTDPLVHVVADGANSVKQAHALCERQFEAWDMLSGIACPHLGGKSRYLDIVGVNYYWNSQWEIGSGRPLRWQLDDPSRIPLAKLLRRVHQRYQRPLVIAETSHSGVRRANWLREIASEVASARRHGAEIEAVCLYPVLDCPDANNLAQWHDCGLWHLERDAGGILQRRLNESYAAELAKAQHEHRAAFNPVLRFNYTARRAGRTLL